MSYDYESHKILLENARLAGKEKIQCNHCNKLFSKLNYKRHNNNCYLNPINIKLCVVCEQPIKNFKTSTTCGYSCSNKHFRTGSSNGAWKESSYRSTCFQYHDKKCVICSEENIVAVHHLDEDKTNNSPENLIPMCPTHHQYWHSRYKYLVEDKVLEYIKNWRT